MKVYLAAMFSTIKERKAQAAELRALGIGVMSRWVEETVPHNIETKDVPEKYLEETSLVDLEDIDMADIFVAFVPTDTELTNATLRASSRGGRHVEFGYALAKRMPIFVLGGKENVFHVLPPRYGIRHYTTWEDMKFALALMRDTISAS